MENMEKQKKIEGIIREFFEKMTLEEEPEDIKVEEGNVSFNIKTEDPEILIGKRGQTLTRVQSVLAKILNKQIGERYFIDFDVNDYKKKKIDYLKQVARDIADEVAITKKEKALPPMTPFERRIIHITLSDREGIQTESEGEDPERKVVVRSA